MGALRHAEQSAAPSVEGSLIPVPHLQVGEAAARVQVGEVVGEMLGMGRIDLAVGSGARRSGCFACAGLLCRWRHHRLSLLFGIYFSGGSSIGRITSIGGAETLFYI